ncbi:MAG: ROK family transcriptional regulator [Myxococcota bacterium]
MSTVPPRPLPRPPALDRVHDSASIRVQHRRLLLGLLWSQAEGSRAELARSTGLSRSTVSAIVSELLDTGLVHETRAGASTGGRRPIILAFRDDAADLVGVDLGASHVAVARSDLRLRVRDHRHARHDVRQDPWGALALVERLIRDLLEESGSADRLIGIGVAAPSPIDPRRPGRLATSVVPEWRGIDLVEVLGAAFGRPVFVDNDANAGALAELWWGGGRSGGDLAYVKIGTGVGAGLVLGGELFRGTAGIAGEIGHLTVDPQGPECLCGLRGCLATFVGRSALLETVKNRRTAFRSSPLQQDPVTLEGIVSAALGGDPLGMEIIDEAGRLLGLGVASLLNVLNPGRVVLAGELVEAGELLLSPLRQTVQSRVLAESVAHVDIDRSTLGPKGVVMGAATLVLQAALAEPALIPRMRSAQE